VPDDPFEHSVAPCEGEQPLLGPSRYSPPFLRLFMMTWNVFETWVSTIESSCVISRKSAKAVIASMFFCRNWPMMNACDSAAWILTAISTTYVFIYTFMV